MKKKTTLVSTATGEKATVEDRPRKIKTTTRKKPRKLVGKHATYTNPNIYQRLSWISEKVSYIKKDEEVAFGQTRYDVATHDAVTAAVQPLLIEAGVLVIPTVMESSLNLKMLRWEKQSGEKKYLRNEFLYCAKYKVSFVNIDKPDDFTYWIGEGFAMDSQDKHPGIAESYAVKRSMLKVLSLETGETDEGRLEMATAISETQSSELKNLINNNVSIFEMLLTYFKLTEVGLDQLPAYQFDQATQLVVTFNEQLRKKAAEAKKSKVAK